MSTRQRSYALDEHWRQKEILRHRRDEMIWIEGDNRSGEPAAVRDEHGDDELDKDGRVGAVFDGSNDAEDGGAHHL